MTFQLRQPKLLMREIVDRPFRLNRELNKTLQGQAEGNGKSGAKVALAIAASDRVHSQHHDADAGGLSPVQHSFV